MSLSKQAKTLSIPQANAVLAMLEQTRHPVRNRVVFLLSMKAGLRAKEIAGLKWSMLTDSAGALSTEIHLTNAASKGAHGGRVIPLNKELRRELAKLLLESTAWAEFVIATERADRTSAQAIVNLFSGWYRALGFNGCSSHSGRRTFVTAAARKISTVGGSLRDVQALAGHSSLSTTQRYIESDGMAQRRVVDLV